MKQFILFFLVCIFSNYAFPFEERVSENIEITCENFKKFNEFDILSFDVLTKSDGFEVYVAIFDFEKSVNKYKSIFVVSQYVLVDKDGHTRNTMFESTTALSGSINEGSKISITFDMSRADYKSYVVYKYIKKISKGNAGAYYRFINLEKLKSCVI